MIDSIVEVLSKVLLGIEFLSALIAFLYFFKLKNTYWKWFYLYLIFIFFQEFYWFFNSSLFGNTKQDYFTYIGIPVQYLFLFWLYALKSIRSKNIFLICLIVYISTYFPFELYYKEVNAVYSLNLTVGTLLLTFLVVLEFRKQIKTDDILKFKENEMFYINAGVVLFYIGTYPFFAFYNTLLKEPFIGLGNFYYIYFKVSVCLMYLLFIASLVWGKHQLK